MLITRKTLRGMRRLAEKTLDGRMDVLSLTFTDPGGDLGSERTFSRRLEDIPCRADAFSVEDDQLGEIEQLARRLRLYCPAGTDLRTTDVVDLFDHTGANIGRYAVESVRDPKTGYEFHVEAVLMQYDDSPNEETSPPDSPFLGGGFGGLGGDL